jgi:hypothetical protein
MKKLFLSTLTIFLLSASGFSQRHTCNYSASDYGASVCEAYANADAVFIGEVIKIVQQTINIQQTDDDYDQTAHITIHKLYKGAPRASIVLRELGSRHTQKFILGARYLFYANYVPALKIWEVRSCGRTRLADYVQADLLYLNGLPKNSKRTRIAGEVARYEPTNDASESPVRLPGVKLKIIGEGREYEAVSDAQGIYEIYDLPPGKYTIRPVIPSGLTFLWALHSGRDAVARAKSLEFDLSPGGCAEMEILLTTEKNAKGGDTQ